MPKRKAPTKISGLLGSDDDELMQMSGNEAPHQELREEPPSKKRRGRPRTSHENVTEPNTTAPSKKAETAASQAEPKRPARRGRPRGSSRTSDDGENARASVTREPVGDEMQEQEIEDSSTSKGARNTRATNTAKPTATRARGRARAASHTMQLQTDGEFEYTPTSVRQTTAQEVSHDAEPSPRPRAAQRRNHETEVAESQHIEPVAEVDESVLPDDSYETRHAISSALNNARSRLSVLRNTQDSSPRKRKSGIETDHGGDPELRRRIGDVTKKHDALESKYRNLREIGIVEANTNMEKLRKQCETITTGMFFSLMCGTWD